MTEKTLEHATMPKVYVRLLGFFLFAYIVAYLDRINVSFAALTMQHDLSMTAEDFGFASGLLFLGYTLFEIPSNLIMSKIGARIWMARIMITWGIVSAATAVAYSATGFAALRFLLGVAEAGFWPGVVFYFSYWIPNHYQSRFLSITNSAVPLAVAIGAPISTAILGLDGMFGLKGWQLMYVFESIPAIVLGVIALWVLTDRPQNAAWLTQQEKSWLVNTLEKERVAKESIQKFSMLQSMFDPKTLVIAANYLCIMIISLGMLIFVPQIIKSLGTVSIMTVGWLTSIPYTAGFVAILIGGFVSDKIRERRWMLFSCCALITVGLLIAGLTMGTWYALFGITLATIGIYASKGPFWSIFSTVFTETSAAVAIAWVSSIGTVGGFLGPCYVGWIKDSTGSFSLALIGLAACGLIATVISGCLMGFVSKNQLNNK